jgi:hypothetical protein
LQRQMNRPYVSRKECIELSALIPLPCFFKNASKRYFNIKPGLLPVQRRLMSVYLIYPQFAYNVLDRF